MKRDYSKAIFYLPRDTTAKALGAQAVEKKLKSRGIEPIRNGSRGMFWLEPLLDPKTMMNLETKKRDHPRNLQFLILLIKHKLNALF